MRKLYYTIEKGFGCFDGIEELTGNKTVDVYEIINNEPKKWFDLDLILSDNSEKEIENYLDDNGYGDEQFELIQL